jgi:4'-phosphopantetheinyl transferase
METIDDIRKLPELGADTIHIWGVHLPDVLDRLDVLHTMLSEKEQAKAARFRREADRQSSIAARGALRILLSWYADRSATEIKFRYSENGKPHMMDSDIDFNVSHSADWVVLAFGRNRNIGVDVEKIKWDMDVLGVSNRFFAAEEVALIESATDKHTAFFQVWAQKEAYVKACGSTLFRELSAATAIQAGWTFQRLEAGSKYAAAVVTDQPLASVPCYDFGGLQWDS